MLEARIAAEGKLIAVRFRRSLLPLQTKTQARLQAILMGANALLFPFRLFDYSEPVRGNSLAGFFLLSAGTRLAKCKVAMPTIKT
jgi:hypothetical protein